MAPLGGDLCPGQKGEGRRKRGEDLGPEGRGPGAGCVEVGPGRVVE